MRHQWRLLLLRSLHSATLRLSTHPFLRQVQSNSNLQSIRFLTSLIHNHSVQGTFPIPINPSRILTRNLSSEPLLETKELDHIVIADIFAKYIDANDVKKELDLDGVVISHEMVLNVLGKLDSSPDVAVRFFNWVSENDRERLSSKSYNMMLCILGVNGFRKEFWDLVDVMKRKGYEVSKSVLNKVLMKFEAEGIMDDVDKLKSLFASGSMDTSAEKICSKVSKIVRSEVWSNDIEKQIKDLNINFASGMVKMVVENVGTEPNKALIFFRWLEESGMFKHDECTYNVMARILGREDTIDRFQKVVDEMKSSGYEIEFETYVEVFGRFCKRRMIREAVDLYEFAMAGANKPSAQGTTILLKKIVVAKELDMTLFSRVVQVFTQNGNVLTNSMLDAVLKSLNSVGRYGECNNVLRVMEEGGFVASSNLRSKIAFRLSAAGYKEETCEFMRSIEASGSSPDHRTWLSLIEGQCVSGDLDKAFESFQKMIEKEGVSSMGAAFNLIVDAYCKRNRAIDAANILLDFVKEKELRPWHSTYKLLISRLMNQKGFNHAVDLLGLMRSHGFPPFVDPFIEHVSKSGTSDNAIQFLKGMTSKRFPSTSVFIRMFEAFFKSKRHNEAHKFLSICPPHIRNHADVLNLFYSATSEEDATPVDLSA